MRLRISYNAPVVLTFALLAVGVFILGGAGAEGFVGRWFVAKPWLHGPSDYVGLVSHILGHKDWNHLLSNFMLILLLGPLLEERFGSGKLLVMILVTALVTGLLNVAIADTGLLGASGIVFMMILLASTANIRQGEIPLTFLAVSAIYLGGEIARALDNDQVSQMAHLIGGCVGAVFGFLAAKGKSLPMALPGATPAASAASVAPAASIKELGAGRSKVR
ncbi:MAG TPA: rhomboid family intramembrane serine protease [Kofleriaceae bacterium]|nr:rhomboid family intramembrane serine protease [Kofleriaceae bacterium]